MVRESAVNTITRPQKRGSFERAFLKARNLHRALKGSFKGALHFWKRVIVYTDLSRTIQKEGSVGLKEG